MTAITLLCMAITFVLIIRRYRKDVSFSAERAILYILLSFAWLGLPILGFLILGLDPRSDLAKNIDIIVFALISLGGFITLVIGFVQFLQAKKYPNDYFVMKSKDIMWWGFGVVLVGIAMIAKLMKKG